MVLVTLNQKNEKLTWRLCERLLGKTFELKNIYKFLILWRYLYESLFGNGFRIYAS